MDPEVWRWIWLATAATFIIGEIATAAFFLLPFGVGAAAAEEQPPELQSQ